MPWLGPFLHHNPVRSCRKILARLRAKILRLRAKTGRWNGRFGIDATGAPYIYVVMGNAAKFGPVTLDVPVLRPIQGQERVVRRGRL